MSKSASLTMEQYQEAVHICMDIQGRLALIYSEIGSMWSSSENCECGLFFIIACEEEVPRYRMNVTDLLRNYISNRTRLSWINAAEDQIGM
jgi:hypothetical protein